MSRFPRVTESIVRDRAAGHCKYCQFPETAAIYPFQIDHIIAEKHNGSSVPENLALACFYCNTYKGPNIAGIDPNTSEVVRLFNPRQDRWSDHFKWAGIVLLGLTPIGRATVETLRINHPRALLSRGSLAQDRELEF